MSGRETVAGDRVVAGGLGGQGGFEVGASLISMGQILAERRVLPDLAAGDRDEAMARLAAVLATDLEGVTPGEILAVLLAREAVGSTGVGRGVAIPHAKLAAVTSPIAAFGRSPAGVDFQALDGAPVHLIMVLLSPVASRVQHVETLVAISRKLRPVVTQRRLMAAEDQAGLFRLMVETGGEA
ncbi:MAG: PTS sugar transporter subunit IIA [Magnetococcales bacterium]|nr:PTS sugar transporter subunit IIA [Magnetococcales bacterium]MBF0156813.1 PTS sugar transporter subunit IIA [Magnetococcales bacterium]